MIKHIAGNCHNCGKTDDNAGNVEGVSSYLVYKLWCKPADYADCD